MSGGAGESTDVPYSDPPACDLRALHALVFPSPSDACQAGWGAARKTVRKKNSARLSRAVFRLALQESL